MQLLAEGLAARRSRLGCSSSRAPSRNYHLDNMYSNNIKHTEATISPTSRLTSLVKVPSQNHHFIRPANLSLEYEYERGYPPASRRTGRHAHITPRGDDPCTNDDHLKYSLNHHTRV